MTFVTKWGSGLTIGTVSVDKKLMRVAIADDRERIGAGAYQALFMHALEGVLFTAPDGAIIAANPAACAMLGQTEFELRQAGRAGVMDPADAERWRAGVEERARLGHFRGELSFRRPDGTTFPAEVTSNVFHDSSGALRTCVMFRDIIERKRAEEQLRALALVDDLTGLHNRRGFLRLAEQALREGRRRGRRVAGLFMDVDGLKTINDNFGHGEGDRLLKAVAEALRTTARQNDILARFGGDEFFVLLIDADTPTAFQRRLDHHVQRSGRHLPYAISLSVGFATWDPSDAIDVEALIRTADETMYRQKSLRRRLRAG